MVLPAPNMDSCCKKERCLSGPNVGSVYDVCEPCPPNNTFDEEQCDCISIFPTGSVQYRIIGGNMTTGTGSTSCTNNPSTWRNAHSAPYIDEQGRLIQYTLKARANWGCVTTSLEYENCNTWDNYATDYKVTKITSCIGGDSLMFYGTLSTYIDGELDSESSDYSFQLHTSCETPPGWTGDPYRASQCAEHYTVPFEWTATIEWRQSDGEGGYIPL